MKSEDVLSGWGDLELKPEALAKTSATSRPAVPAAKTTEPTVVLPAKKAAVMSSSPIQSPPTFTSSSSVRPVAEPNIKVSPMASALCSESPTESFISEFLRSHPVSVYSDTSDIKPFAFDTLSPDDLVFEARKKAFQQSKCKTESTPKYLRMKN